MWPWFISNYPSVNRSQIFYLPLMFVVLKTGKEQVCPTKGHEDITWQYDKMKTGYLGHKGPVFGCKLWIPQPWRPSPAGVTRVGPPETSNSHFHAFVIQFNTALSLLYYQPALLRGVYYILYHKTKKMQLSSWTPQKCLSICRIYIYSS